jgi:hypothetical protein
MSFCDYETPLCPCLQINSSSFLFTQQPPRDDETRSVCVPKSLDPLPMGNDLLSRNYQMTAAMDHVISVAVFPNVIYYTFMF